MATEEQNYVHGWGTCSKCKTRRPVALLKEEIEKRENSPDVKVVVCADGWCEKCEKQETVVEVK